MRRTAIALPILVLLLWFVPILVLIWLIAGAIDVGRNRAKSKLMLSRYFFGNGMMTWLLSPLNLLIDCISHRNAGIYALSDLPAASRQELEEVLGVFQQRKDAVIAEVDRQFADGRRGMYVYLWYGKRQNETVREFNRDFKYVKTIAVSVFSGKESTSWHYGPLRLTLRVLLNLNPTESDRVFIECNGERHIWRDDPLFIFDDTLFHRSVNEIDHRRYNVFIDVLRPSPVPGVLGALLGAVSLLGHRLKGMFYRNWKMLGAGAG